MKEAFADVLLYREFAQLDMHGHTPDESAIPVFRRWSEKDKLADAILATVKELLSSQGLLLRQRSKRYADCRTEFDKAQGRQTRP